jgi:MscS family membrane protein
VNRTAIATAFATALWAALATAGAAQIPFGSSQTPAPAAVVDPLGRGTPRGAVVGFVMAVRHEDLSTAARFLQLSPKTRANGEALARDLNAVLDRYLPGVMAISDEPAGAQDDGLPRNRERIAEVTSGGQTVDITLVRITDPDAGPIWLVAADTLAEIPDLAASLDATWVDRSMPRSLLTSRFLGVSVAHWIVWAGSLLLPLVLFWLLARLFAVVTRRVVTYSPRLTLLESWHAALAKPLVVALALYSHCALLYFAGFSLRFRLVYGRIALACAVAATMWLLWTILAYAFEIAAGYARSHGRPGTSSLMNLAERVSKVLVVVVAVFMALKVAGVDTTTALAGLGLGGIAVALGAQKSVENLLGGVFLLSDGALAVGDNCAIANREGIVEDVTLRSVRLRTTEQTLLSVPAGVLAQSSVENLSSRRKILIRTTLRLRYGTTSEQLQSILDAIRSRLEHHPNLERGSARIQLVDFGLRAVELELFAYAMTGDWLAFLAIREALLLEAASIVEASGSAFAQPTQFVYLEHEAGADDTARDGQHRPGADETAVTSPAAHGTTTS